MEKRGMWSSRLTFILAAVGSAVGLGNAWRFPGLAAKHGGGTFLVVYLLAMLVMGIPLLMMEISIARKFRRGAIESMRGIGKKWEFVGSPYHAPQVRSSLQRKLFFTMPNGHSSPRRQPFFSQIPRA